jgi:zinc protease
MRFNRAVFSTIIAAYCFSAIAAFAQAPILKPVLPKLPADPEVATGHLPNGLTYYIRHNNKPEHKVELRLVVKAGSILEDEKQLGLAHFMEHMNFNGTKNFQKNDLVSYLQSIGVQFGADLNANTGFDQTIYILPIPTDKPDNIEKGFQIIEDWSHNALLTDKDIDDERGVVLEESRLGKGANMRMLNTYFPQLASGSLYAARLPIGKDDILKNFKYDEIRRFYKDWYRPDLEAVIIVGDIDTTTAKKMVMAHFGNIKNPEGEKKRFSPDVKPRTSPEAMVVTDKEATNSVLQILYPYTHKRKQVTLADYKEDLERQLVLQMMNERLSDLSQGSTPPFLGAEVSFEDLIQGYESFGMGAAFGKDGAAKALNALTGELIKAQKYGFAPSELDRAKKEMESSIEKSYNERHTTESATYTEEYIRAFTQDEPFPGIEKEYGYYKIILPEIQVAQLNGLVNAWTKDANTFTLITGPEKVDVQLPTSTELLAMTSAAMKQDIQKTEEKVVAASLMSTLPTPGNVVSKTQEAGLDATTYTLSNGIQVTIKPTTFKSDEVLMTGVKKGGKNNYGLADKNNAQFATQITDAMGVGTFSPNDLEKVIAGKTMSVAVSMADITDGVTGKSSIRDFESMLQLMNLTLTQPRKDEGLYKAFTDKSKTMLQYITANPQAAFADTLSKVLYNNNPLAKRPFPKASDFDEINLDRTLQIYRNEFSTANGYHFFIVGNINPETAIPLINTYIGSLQQDNTPANFKDNGVRPITGEHQIKVYKGKEKKSLIISVHFGETTYSEDLALKAQAVADILNIKVIENLREKLGGIYTGGFGSKVEKEPYQHYSITLQLPCGPENVDKLIAAAEVEIKHMQQQGPDEADLQKVKNTWLEKHNTAVAENGYWSGKLENILFWNTDKDRVLHYSDYVNKLTKEDIKNTAITLFTGKNEFTAILYPEQ